MFTGLIQTQSQVIENTSVHEANRLVIDAVIDCPVIGESIAVNGVCLTLLGVDGASHTFDVSKETLQKTNLGALKPGASVNIERAMGAQDRFGGHYVTGHVDTVAILTSMQSVGDCLEISVSHFGLPESALYLIPKGSITLDGVSLTINEVLEGVIQLMLIPHTLASTTFHQLQLGHQFNVEFDYMARIIAHQLAIISKINKEVV